VTTMNVRYVFLLMILAGSAPTFADPGNTCVAACRRIRECKLAPFDACVDYCTKQGADASAAGRASNLVQARSSCSQLAAQMRPSQWVCTAEGASASRVGAGPVLSTPVFTTGRGRTRAAASLNAVSDCRAVLTFNLYIAESPSTSDTVYAEVTAACRVTQCYSPAP
jgi:hypothetical protein